MNKKKCKIHHKTFPIALRTDRIILLSDKYKFTISDVDYFKIQFISQGLQGINFAVKKYGQNNVNLLVELT